MGHLTNRDQAANDLRPLFTNTPLRSDADCPRTLNDPVPPIQKLSSTKPIDVDRPLPQTGNWADFLKILLKIELDLCDEGDGAKAEILKQFQQITTTGEAKAYMPAMGQRIAAVRVAL